jgi:hypothetical protein
MMPHLIAIEQRRDTGYVRCQECGKPIAEVRDGMLVIKVKHHGDWHVSVIPLSSLLERAA